ncbi:MAG TPA: DUF6112 family protein [Mycobacteriales bacterium]|jgi:hypothetical protein
MWRVPAQVDVNLKKDGLPGGDALATLVGGLMWMGLLACVGAIIIGAAAWGLSAHSGNYHGAYMGRKAVLGGFFGALLIGAAAAIVTFAFNAGQKV